MRAHEIMENLDGTTETMMLKLRKDSAATLNAKTLAGIFSVIDGWKMEVVKDFRLSDGGWVMSDTPMGKMLKESRVNLSARLPFDDKASVRMEISKAYTDEKLKDMEPPHGEGYVIGLLKNEYLPLLKAAEASPKGRWRVEDVQVNDGPDRKYGGDGKVKRYEISFKFFVQMNVTVITAPDGQTYEVFGDFKNGAIAEQTYVSFFEWAKENTTFMDQILNVLGMEPIAPKEDPKTRFIPPPSAAKEIHQCVEIIEPLVEQAKPGLIKILLDDMERQLDRYVEAIEQQADPKQIARLGQQDNGMIGQAADKKTGVRHPNYKAAFKTYAEEVTESLCNQFVRKNVLKLAPVMAGKGNFKGVSNVSTSIQAGLSASMTFHFEDGSSFKVINKTVTSSMPSGRGGGYTYFYRFPTTFHDVVMPNGQKMGMPSLERMISIFSTT